MENDILTVTDSTGARHTNGFLRLPSVSCELVPNPMGDYIPGSLMIILQQIHLDRPTRRILRRWEQVDGTTVPCSK